MQQNFIVPQKSNTAKLTVWFSIQTALGIKQQNKFQNRFSYHILCVNLCPIPSIVTVTCKLVHVNLLSNTSRHDENILYLTHWSRDTLKSLSAGYCRTSFVWIKPSRLAETNPLEQPCASAITFFCWHVTQRKTFENVLTMKLSNNKRFRNEAPFCKCSRSAFFAP